MTTRLRRGLLIIAVLLLSGVLGTGTASAADPYGSLSENVVRNQIAGPYEIEVVGATFVDDGAFAVTIEVDGAPAPAATTVAFLLAPESEAEARASTGFGSAAAATVFTPEQERAASVATPTSPGAWVLNPAPLSREGSWKGGLVVTGPAGPARAGFTFDVYPARPALSPWFTLTQPLIPVVVLGLALALVRVRRAPLMRPAEPDTAETRSEP